MGNKTTVEVTEQTLYNIDILEDETTVVTVEVPQDIVTVEVSQFTVAVELYNSDNDVEGQPVYAKSGADFTLRSFTDDQKTVDISHTGPSNELIQVKLPDTGIRVKDGFVISTDSDDTANITFNGSNIDIYGVDDITVSNLTATNATVTTATITTLDGTNLDYTVGNITTVNATTVNSTTVNTDLVNTDAVQFDLTAGVTPQVGQLAWNADDGTLEFKVNNEVTLQIGQENLIHVKNLSGGALNNGDVVYVTGASGSKITVDRADSSQELSSATTIAVMTQSLNNNAVGYATTSGLVRGLNTSMFLEGKALYLNSSGGYTDVKPLTPEHLVPIGWVVRSHATEGSIFVHINNGQELEELHDVLITTISDNDLLMWNAAQNYWENVEGTTTSIAEGTNLYYTRARVEGVLQTYDGNFTANNATITNNISSANITATVGNITTVNATDVNTTTVTATTGAITTVNATDVNATDTTLTGTITAPTGAITTVNSTTLNTTDVNATTGAITTVNATNLNTTDLSVTGTATIATGDITTVNATDVNTTDISATGNADITGNLIVTGNATVASDVVVSGNLTVNGTTTTVNTETLEVADNNIVLNSNHTGTPTQDGGITIERGSEVDAVLQWNETSDKFEVKVGTAYAVFKAEDVESSTLTATQATITTGDITTVNATNVNSTNLDVDTGSIDTLTAVTVAATGNISTTANVIISGGNLDLNGGQLQDVSEINDLSVLRVGVENPSTVGGDGIVLWDRTTNWILENKLSTQNNADDVVHDGGTAPIGDIVYITNNSIEMSANIVASGGTNGTVITNGRIVLEKLAGTQTENIYIDGSSGISMTGQNITGVGNIVPESDLAFNLGSPSKAWHSAYIGPGSLYIDGQKVLGSDASGTIDFTTDDGQSINIFAGANGPGGEITIGSAGATTNLQDATVNLGPSAGSGTINIRGTLESPNTNIGDLELSATLINQTATNQNLEIRTNNGYLHANVTDLYVGPLSGALKIDETSLSLTAGGTISINNNTDINGDLDVSGIIKVDDGFTLNSFNPYAPYGGTAMPTTIMGAGQQSGWSGVTIRSRGEHDWGLGGFGIPPEAPRAINAMMAGRLDAGSDDYLNSGDLFAQIMMNPYSAYRTGTEWLTPAVSIESVATENHSSSGMGTKLRINTTKNGDFAGATDAAHSKDWIDIQGTTLTTSSTLNINDAVEITGTLDVNDVLTVNGSTTSKSTVVGDYQYGGAYDFHGFQLNAGDTAWAGVVFSEYAGSGTTKPGGGDFTNPGLATEVYGGTPSSPTALGTGKRLISVTGTGSNDSTGVIPGISNVRLIGETTEQQSLTNRGAKWSLFSTPNGQTSPQNTLQVREGNRLTIGNGSYESGHGYIEAGGGDLKINSRLDTNNWNIINSGGDVTVDDNLQVNNNLKVNNDLTVDGNTTLKGNSTIGNDNTADFVQINARVDMNGLFGLINIDTATANYYAGLENGGFITMNAGSIVYVTDGDAGNPCLAVYNGSSWKRVSLGSDISTT